MYKMRHFLKGIDRYLVGIVIAVAIQIVVYFCTGKIQTQTVSVWCPWDDLIPFVPFFVTFYTIWFVYILVSLIALWHLHKVSAEDHCEFIKFLILLGGGLAVCTCIFVLFPTQIPEGFRGDLANRSNIFTQLLGVVYDNDALKNAFPSEHCFTALCFCWGFLRSPAVRASKHRFWVIPLNIFLALTICASTVLVKQHSILDFFGAIGLMGVLIAIIYAIPWKRKRAGV